MVQTEGVMLCIYSSRNSELNIYCVYNTFMVEMWIKETKKEEAIEKHKTIVFVNSE